MQVLWYLCKTIFCKGVLFTQYSVGLRLSQSLKGSRVYGKQHEPQQFIDNQKTSVSYELIGKPALRLQQWLIDRRGLLHSRVIFDCALLRPTAPSCGREVINS
jgi:hypothetical protein